MKSDVSTINCEPDHNTVILKCDTDPEITDVSRQPSFLILKGRKDYITKSGIVRFLITILLLWKFIRRKKGILS